jgi:23S rRNA (guanosine2251-2'-O)-methyltransferase
MRARRRQVYSLQVARGVEEKGRLAEILEQANSLGIPMERVQRQALDSRAENHQGVALETSEYQYSTLPDIFDLARQRQEPLFVLLLDTLQNPQNLGTLLRTAEAAGVHGALIPFRRTATVTPAVVHASAGATEHLLLAQGNLAQTIETLKAENAWVIGLDGGPQSQDAAKVRLDGPLALVVGNEGEGMRSLIRRSCDVLMRLPMRGQIESLNASVAGSIALYLALEAREKAKK